MSIDVHFHIVPILFLEALRRGDLQAAVQAETQHDRDTLTFHAPPHIVLEPGISVRPNQYDERMLLAAMDVRRLDAAAVSPPPELLLYWAPPDVGDRIARTMNDGLAQLARSYPDRFLPLATLPMQDTDLAVRELERAITNLGLRGIVLCTHIGGRDLDDPRYEPVFAAAARLKVPVFLHPQNTGDIAPAQIVRDAKLHGVTVRSVCINASAWDCTLEPTDGPYFAVRLGLRIVKGLSEANAGVLIARRGEAAYPSVEDVWRRTAVPVAALEQLADADAFHDLGLSRRQALWAILGLDHTELPLMRAVGPPAISAQAREPGVTLRRMSAGGEVVADYGATGLTLRQHPVSFLRDQVQRLGAVPCARLPELRPGQRITVAGIVLVRQRPGSAKGVMFATIEDETGHANIIVWPSVLERQRRIVLAARMIACRGRLQRESDVIHVVAEELIDLSDLLEGVGRLGAPFPLSHGRGDQVTHSGGPDPREMPDRKPRSIYVSDIHLDALKVKSRDFH